MQLSIIYFGNDFLDILSVWYLMISAQSWPQFGLDFIETDLIVLSQLNGHYMPNIQSHFLVHPTQAT